MTHGEEARRFLRTHHSGVLSTVSASLSGYPFGSIVPFVLDADCRPVILISALAEHTKNLAGDPRASLIVHGYEDDVQAGPRLTLVGDAARVPDDPAVRNRYLRYFPAAQNLLALGDFSFWAIAPQRLLFIRGFGHIHWIDPDAFRPPENRLAAAEEEIVAHLNADHAATLADYCGDAHGVAPREVGMVGIDCDGFDLRADGRRLRIAFDEPVTDAGKARATLVAMARRAREG
ncbi:MAG: HugZ family protein [Burkholderiales bacterium]